ncbi:MULTISPECIES: glycosyltransferase family 2 protein [Francisella]|uniref:glycosyltransferase family 2 protein n=1 Tax=Francisella TaxID=262 RepID=UPI00123DA16A|nr:MULTISPECIES: glycosyltransferase [Francisella]MBK2297078.1 glycosyltransferase [Francisella philomiragia]MBK2341324.1 glycosyltransferase [Francisella philomiragia]
MVKIEKDIMKDWSEDAKPLLSVYCATYNHEKYISQAIDSFLMQETDFPFEIIINDDCSKDNTAKIVSEYYAKYPNIIRPIFQTENQNSIGLTPFVDIMMPISKGRYIATCEGDDYWTDPLKLQKQVDFLESHPNFMGCVHATRIVEEYEETLDIIPHNAHKADVFTFENYSKAECYFHTSSCVYRYESKYKSQVDEYFKYACGDWYFSMVFSSFGPIKYIDEVMSVYRIHGQGMWSTKAKDDKEFANILLCIKAADVFPEKYQQNFYEIILNSIKCNSMNVDKLSEFLMGHLNSENIQKIMRVLLKAIGDMQSNISKHISTIKECNDYIKVLEKSLDYEKSITLYKHMKLVLRKFYNKIVRKV